ncbi:MAG: STAS-like domain-containing protein [Alphaproteobacteria bacterium]
MKKLKISTDFSDTPGARYETDGPFSGEVFRKDFLLPALEGTEGVEIDLNDVEGFGSSFLEEAFGGLVRSDGYKADELLRRLKFKSLDAVYIDQITRYIRNAQPMKENLST